MGLRKRHVAVGLAAMALLFAGTQSARAAPANQVLGTWRMVKAEVEQDGITRPAYGTQPRGMLVFTPDMHFVEVLTDASVPRFASQARGQGTDAENRAAMAANIGFFGTYTVDAQGEFSGNRVQGATFPNWVGSARTRQDLSLVVEGDRMVEHFRRPEGARVYIEWERVRTAQ
ncbi:lipocalin-like domain-containing protein [Orrella dioscoreae]|uniref:Lipocalin-like domain-containing protein n=1 Tax=Orrella dioscoreae TaxID=1851544 RepID=A0A1C3K578_9BURK|nr:lipocalin-like domain-containing protein [Orrella dioscoreae]SBT26669.1 hypothetical protein ODI_00858 [Orrella dioscoreae]SOE49791.1 hypothetical protein ODI_R2309 [Orrella dioscoreae]